ncbi:uncharacterized protein LOC113766935 [Coffea eugenioides]|uniref:uncharacterized protein LOC113766935 n=1 Tax=Coffea eugenioides TaxID=49369 RepID=UPI000F605B5E|nr:uncharacterized protein LOC113766935 [Coffea eugenioides]
MNPNKSSIRPLGQRSIHSTFIFRSSNRSSDFKKTVEIKASNEKGSQVSLSEFLNRKLHQSSVLPGSAQGKERPFLSPVSYKDVNPLKGETSKKEMSNGEKDFAVDIVLEQFKHSTTETKSANSFGSNKLMSATTGEYEIQESGKRKRGDYQKPAKKLVAVLGDDSVTQRGGRRKSLANHEKPNLLFNHYANGGGWWDDSMEGVDNEEVGCAEVWEGMGSTTLGGLDWH